MANVLFFDTIKDHDGVPVAGAIVYVYDGTGLATLYDAMGQQVDNPVTTDEDGYWEAWVPEEKYYTTKYYWGGRLRYTNANILAGNPPVGPNSDPNVRPDLASTDPGKGAGMVGYRENTVVEALDERRSVLNFPGDTFADKFEAACNSGNGLVYIPQGNHAFDEAKTITGVPGLRIINDGIVTASEDLVFTSCHGLSWSGDGQWIGNSVPVGEVTALPNTNEITLDSVDGFAVGDDIIVHGVEDDNSDPMPWFAFRGTITGINGLTITATPDTTLGGSYATIAVGHKARVVIAANSAVQGEIRVNTSDRPKFRGYFERDIYFNNCSNIDAQTRHRYSYPWASFCRGGKLYFVTEEGRFYAGAVFKSRGIEVIGWFDTAYFGGFVAKNNYGGSYLVNGRRGLVYGVQLRDDTGSAGSIEGLPPTVADTRQQALVGINVSECGVGVLFDNFTHGAACGPIVIERGSGQGPSVRFAGACSNIIAQNVVIRDHGQCLTQIGTFNSNTDIVFEKGTDIDLKAKVIGSLHTTAVNSFTSSTPGEVARVQMDLSLDNCVSGARVHGAPTDVAVSVDGYNPAASGKNLLTISGSPAGVRVTRWRPIAGTNDWSRGVSVETGGSGMGSITISGGMTRPGDVSFADIFIDPNNSSGSVRVTSDNDLQSTATNGISTRRCNAVYIEGPINTGHGTNYHFNSFAAANGYRIYGREQRAFLSVPFSTATQATLTEQTQTVACAGWTANCVLTGPPAIRGSSLAGVLRVSHSSAGNVTVGLFNPTGGDISVSNPTEVTVTFREEFKP